MSDDHKTINDDAADGRENIPSPKVPERNDSSLNYVVKFKKNNYLNQTKHAGNHLNNKNNINPSKCNSKQEMLTRNNYSCENGERNDNWRPLRDFF